MSQRPISSPGCDPFWNISYYDINVKTRRRFERKLSARGIGEVGGWWAGLSLKLVGRRVAAGEGRMVKSRAYVLFVLWGRGFCERQVLRELWGAAANEGG